MNVVKLLIVLLLLLAVPAMAGDLMKDPGYIDLEWIQIPEDAYEIQDIDLGPALISAAADAEKNGETELFELFTMLKSIRVRSFSLDDPSDKVERDVAKVTDMLEDKGWKRMIYVKDADQIVTVSSKSVDGEIIGLTVVAYEPEEEAAFVNVVGHIDLAHLLGIAGRLHGESLDNFVRDLRDSGLDIDIDD